MAQKRALRKDPLAEVAKLNNEVSGVKQKINAIINVCNELQAAARANSMRSISSHALLQALCAKLLSGPLGPELKIYLEELFKLIDQSPQVQSRQDHLASAVPSPLPIPVLASPESSQPDQAPESPHPHPPESTQLDPQPVSAEPPLHPTQPV